MYTTFLKKLGLGWFKDYKETYTSKFKIKVISRKEESIFI